MFDPIRSSLAPYHASHPLEMPHATKASSKEDTHAAEQEIASLYTSTLQSMAPKHEEKSKAKALQAQENKVTERSLLGRMKDWMWGIIGWGKKQPPTVDTPAVESAADHPASEKVSQDSAKTTADKDATFASGVPVLEEPENVGAQAMVDLHRDLVQREKEIAEFEEEMRNSTSFELDKRIFQSLIACSLRQKEHKEALSLTAKEELMTLHEKNRKLQKEHFSLIETINKDSKKLGILGWVNIGLSVVGIGGTLVALVASGGTGAIMVGVPLSYFGKAIVTGTEGVYKHRNDGRTRDLVGINYEKKRNTSKKHDKIDSVQGFARGIAEQIKKIRQHLDNQTKAERASFGRR